MTRYKFTTDGIILAIIAGLLLQAVIYNVFGINVAEVPAKMIIILWGVFAAAFGALENITEF